MTDFFESQGDSIDPDNFNIDVHQSVEQNLPLRQNIQQTQTIDVRIGELKKQVNDFREQLTIQSSIKPKNDLVLIETLLRDLQNLSQTNSGPNDTQLSKYIRQLETLASPQQTDKQQLKLIFSTTNQEHDRQQTLENRVMLVESVLGSQRERKQIQLEQQHNNLPQNVMAQMSVISTSIKNLKESQIDYKEPIQELYKKISLMQQVDEPEQVHQLNIIFERVKSIQGICDVLPLLSKRLDQLREVHQKSIGIKQQFETMVSRHQNVVELIKKNQTKVDSLKDKIFTQYNSLIKDLEALDSKYAKKL